jgi:hypothetical protein
LSKVAALWSGRPISVRLDDLDRICAALDCTVEELIRAEPVAATVTSADELPHAAAGSGGGGGMRAVRPTPRSRRGGGRSLPPN